MYNSIVLIILVLPFLASLTIPFISHGQRDRSTGVMITTATLGLILTLSLFPAINDGAILRQAFTWAPAFGLEFVLRLDGLSWLFLLLICGIGVLVAIYASYYMPREYPLVRFFAFLLVFMGSMLGLVLSGNVIQLVFFWELTSLLSFLLIGFWYQGESARDAARTALTVTAAGGLALLAGVMMLGHIVGSYDLDAILAAGRQIQDHPLYLPALLCVLTGVFTKSAQFPFHFWLPQAMSAPTPVSAYLHSATLVKAGVFLLLRFWPVLAGSSAWFWLVGGIGMLSLLVGGWGAYTQRDLKALLAYSTISHLGLITMLAGLGSRLGAVAAIFHIVNHATFKASLFMAAGAVDHETGTRDLDRLSGLRHVMPVTATLAIISSAAMAGVPMLNGFLSKEMFFAVTLNSNRSLITDVAGVFLAIIAAGLSVAYSVRLVGDTFFGPVHTDYPRKPQEPSGWMRFPIGLLALICFAVGMFPALVIGDILHAAVTAVLGDQLPVYDLQLWHGWNTPLLMSILAFALGCGLYLWSHWRIWRRGYQKAPIEWISAKQIFERLLLFVTNTLPAWQGRIFPSRRLQTQLLIIMLVAMGLALGSAVGLHLPRAWHTPIDPIFAFMWVLGGICAIGAASQAKFHRMMALALTGGVGLIICISFIWLSAPDLAMTQLLVETVTTVLILLGLRWLPPRIRTTRKATRRARYRRRRDIVIALLVGTGMAVLAYTVMQHPVSNSVSQFYLEQALPSAGGHNVVNVILVDFRALDTLGEISVLVIVALSVLALLRRFRPAPESIGMTSQQQYFQQVQKTRLARAGKVPDYLAIPSLIIMLMTPMFVLFGIHLFLRGHDLPGGGFAAGITLTMALIVLYMARGARWVEARLRIDPVRWIAAGLLIAIATGLSAFLSGRPFLTSYNDQLYLPLLGRIPINSALFFDLGIFAVVIGASSLILVVLAHQTLRRPAKRAQSAPSREGK